MINSFEADFCGLLVLCLWIDGDLSQEVLTGYVGAQALARHLDSDEAVVLGASLRAANLSDGIKLNRKLGMVDGASYGIDIKLDGATLEAKDHGLLVPLHRNLPGKVSTIPFCI